MNKSFQTTNIPVSIFTVIENAAMTVNYAAFLIAWNLYFHNNIQSIYMPTLFDFNGVNNW